MAAVTPGDGVADGPLGAPEDGRPLRRGWTTGACATAAARAAWSALVTGAFPDPVTITLPRGEIVAFALAHEAVGPDWAEAGVIKDAGDDPDVTHGALIRARVVAGAPGSGVCFRAGPGVGTVTRPGLPLAVGEPAINPVPRRMIADALAAVGPMPGAAGAGAQQVDALVTVSVDHGAALAQKTWNPRLGILGGLSILGTTGIVVPYSCAAWIHSIQRGVDVARAAGLTHIAAATGRTSERAVRMLYGLPDHALIDMGDFAGGLFKYLRRHPVPRLTLAGGIGKLTKLGQGLLDLHAHRGSVDPAWLADQAGRAGASADLVAALARAGTALEALSLAASAGVPLGDRIAEAAAATASETINRPVAPGAGPGAGSAVAAEAGVRVAVLVVDRTGQVVGRWPRTDV